MPIEVYESLTEHQKTLYCTVVWAGILQACPQKIAVFALKHCIKNEDLKLHLRQYYLNQSTINKQFFTYEQFARIIADVLKNYVEQRQSSNFEQDTKIVTEAVYKLIESNQLTDELCMWLPPSLEDLFKRVELDVCGAMFNLWGTSLLTAIDLPENVRPISPSTLLDLEDSIKNEKLISSIFPFKMLPVLLTEVDFATLLADESSQKLLLSWLTWHILNKSSVTQFYSSWNIVYEELFKNYDLRSINDKKVLSFFNTKKDFKGIERNEFFYIIGCTIALDPKLCNALLSNDISALSDVKSFLNIYDLNIAQLKTQDADLNKFLIKQSFPYYECVDKYFEAIDDKKEIFSLIKFLKEKQSELTPVNWVKIESALEKELQSVYTRLKMTKMPGFEILKNNVSNFTDLSWGIKGLIHHGEVVHEKLSIFCDELLNVLPEIKFSQMAPVSLGVLALNILPNEASFEKQNANRVLNCNWSTNASDREIFERDQALKQLDLIMNVPPCYLDELAIWSKKKKTEFELSQSIYLLAESLDAEDLSGTQAEIAHDSKKNKLIITLNTAKDSAYIGEIIVSDIYPSIAAKAQELALILNRYSVSRVMDLINNKEYKAAPSKTEIDTSNVIKVDFRKK